MEKLNLIDMTILELILTVIIALIAGFCFGLVTGLNASDYANEETNINDKLYCFQCEIEMPVRIKYGNAYCSNCGLHHGEKL